MIEVERLTKTFPATRRTPPKDAVRDVSFRCVPGEVYALLGPNGAGKTSTLRVIATTLRPTSGTVKVQGHDVVAEPRMVGASIGFLTGNTAPYGRLTAREVVVYFARLYGVAEERIGPRVDALAMSLQMGEFIERRCDKLSQGQKQKVSIARTIVHDPPVLILDEPTAGLDVLAAAATLEFVDGCRRDGKCVLFSTHIMSEVERLCDRIAIIHRGTVRALGTLAELREQTGEHYLEDVFRRVVAGGP